MLTKISLYNFKSHSQSTLSLTNLNLFTGMNGMGKSSVIQAFLLLRQTFQKNMLDIGLELKGSLCQLGTSKDALYQSANKDEINFYIEFEDKSFNWNFPIEKNKPNDTFIKLSNVPDNENKNTLTLSLKNENLFNNNFQYISAFRNGPVLDFEKDTSTVEFFHQISQKEGRCELIAHYLDYFKNDSISSPELKKNPNDQDERLLHQVSEWLKEISPEIEISITANETSYKIDYSFSRGKGKVPTEKFKAYNVGFGISYALPIVVAALHSPKGSLVIIENPEAHIHPEGQAKLMELISRAALRGVQFIIETHSDHVVNGLLVSVKKKLISPEQTTMYYFDREKTMHETKITALPILQGGKIKRPPKGFFDRMDKDLDILMDL